MLARYPGRVTAARPQRTRLALAVDALRALYGAVPTEAGSPWKQILWENCCYLADDGRRARAFATLERKTRLDPARILAAAESVLREVTGAGIIPERFIDKLRQCAHPRPPRTFPG